MWERGRVGSSSVAAVPNLSEFPRIIAKFGWLACYVVFPDEGGWEAIRIAVFTVATALRGRHVDSLREPCSPSRQTC